MTWTPGAVGALILMLGAAAPPAHAQSTTPTSPWSVEAAVGWDNGIGGHINSSAIGTLNGQAVVIKPNTFEEVYGTGLHLRFGGAYALSEATEITGNFTFQSLDADQVVMGLRRYLPLTPMMRAYGEGTLGVGFVDKTDITLVAPGANLARDANDFYDQTAAFAAGANVGILYGAGRMGLFGQLGLRWMSGMDEVDDLQGTGLDDINDKSSRWTLPFVGGVRVRF
jgi:hypothetical protein